MGSEIVRQAMGTAFGILQALFIAAMIGAFKVVWDVKQLKSDMDAAFTKLRALERMSLGSETREEE